MIRLPRSWFFVVAAAAAVSVLPAAAEPSGSQSASSRPERDPNEIVCERQPVLGSRLSSRKVCMTRAEWTEQRRDARENVDRSQTGSCMRQSGC